MSLRTGYCNHFSSTVFPLFTLAGNVPMLLGAAGDTRPPQQQGGGRVLFAASHPRRARTTALHHRGGAFLAYSHI